ncbi:MAG: glycosyltransferase family 4 protein [Candidatus Aminicenantes bacterium]|nr:glycosyltransferase family 4 protein [Candidatus Aminicenantes bacterium]
MISVLFVSHSAELNGAELWLLETLRRLDRKVFVPSLILPRPGPLQAEAEKAGIPVDVVPMKWWVTEKSRVWRQPVAWMLNRRAVRRIAALARERKAEVVFSNSAATFGGALAAGRAGLLHIWSIHEILSGEQAFLHHLRGAKALTGFILSRSNRVIVNSERTRAAFPDSEKIVLVYNGLTIRPGDPEMRPIIKAEFALEDGSRAVGVIGKLYPGKGQMEALQAFTLIADRYPDLKLIFIGATAEAKYEADLRRFIRLHGVFKRVFFAGFRTDLTEVLQTLSVVVVASVVDSFGRAALESMAAGVPVLAVRSGGLPEIVRHGENGFLADSREPEVLAKALADVLDHPERRPAITKNGFRTVRERFSGERQVKDVERVILEVCGRTLLVPPPLFSRDEGPLFASGGPSGAEEPRA